MDINDLYRFQFHKGTIRTTGRSSSGTLNGYFNSIKVRLEQKRKDKAAVTKQFQFHKGTIRTYQGAYICPYSRISIP